MTRFSGKIYKTESLPRVWVQPRSALAGSRLLLAVPRTSPTCLRETCSEGELACGSAFFLVLQAEAGGTNEKIAIRTLNLALEGKM